MNCEKFRHAGDIMPGQDLYWVKWGGWTSRKVKTLKTAIKYLEQCRQEMSMDKSGDVDFVTPHILKNGRKVPGY